MADEIRMGFWISEAKELAQFIAELTRQGVTFSVERKEMKFIVCLTGGF